MSETSRPQASRKWAKAYPDAFELARVCSPAARVDPALLRALRLSIVKRADASTEADLWFSPLVQFRSHQGITLFPEVLEELRGDLANDRDLFARACKIIEATHAHLPELARIEEQLTQAAFDPDATGDRDLRIERTLHRVIDTMTRLPDRAKELSAWFLRALPRLPERVRRSGAAWMLALAAGARLSVGPAIGDEAPSDTVRAFIPGLLPPNLPDVEVGVERRGNDVLVGVPVSDATRVVLPATIPLLIEIESGEQRQVVMFRPGGITSARVSGPKAWLRTLRGDAYEMRPRLVVSQERQDEAWALAGEATVLIVAVLAVEFQAAVDMVDEPLALGGDLWPGTSACVVGRMPGAAGTSHVVVVIWQGRMGGLDLDPVLERFRAARLVLAVGLVGATSPDDEASADVVIASRLVSLDAALAGQLHEVGLQPSRSLLAVAQEIVTSTDLERNFTVATERTGIRFSPRLPRVIVGSAAVTERLVRYDDRFHQLHARFSIEAVDMEKLARISLATESRDVAVQAIGGVVDKMGALKDDSRTQRAAVAATAVARTMLERLTPQDASALAAVSSEGRHSSEPASDDVPIVILWVAAGPWDNLQLVREWREIERQIGGSTHRESFSLVSVRCARVADLRDALQQHRPAIVHFSGHGVEGRDPGLLFEDETGKAVHVPAKALGEAFRALGATLRVVVLSACYSTSQAASIARHVDCVIGVGGGVSEGVTVAFASAFYQGLGFGKSVLDAFDLGRNQVQIMGPDGPESIALHVREGVDPAEVLVTRTPTPPVTSASRIEPVATVAWKRTLRWLHISDLHLGSEDGYAHDIVLQALTAAFRDYGTLADRRPDVIFCTGDIARSGKREEYAAASRFFEALADTTQVPFDRILVVPGNHDMDRDRISRSFVLSLDDRSAADLFFGPDGIQERGIAFRRFTAYAEFQSARFAVPLTPERPFMIARCRVGSELVGVIGLNTAWLAHDGRAPGNIVIGERLVRRALDELDQMDKSLTVRMALLHHPLEWLHDFERDVITGLLAERVDFILHGHLHAQRSMVILPSAGSAAVMAAGASYQVRNRRTAALLVELSAREARVEAIRFRERGAGIWMLDPFLAPRDGGVLRIPRRVPSGERALADGGDRFETVTNQDASSPPSGQRMRPEARALGQALLDHHRIVTHARPPGKRLVHGNYTIRYGALCAKAGVSHVLRGVGTFLQEIAEWCALNGYPPLNALAVNETGMPGDGFDGAGRFRLADWPTDVERCIRFRGYPSQMP